MTGAEGAVQWDSVKRTRVDLLYSKWLGWMDGQSNTGPSCKKPLYSCEILIIFQNYPSSILLVAKPDEAVFVLRAEVAMIVILVTMTTNNQYAYSCTIQSLL